jgi:TolA-binding protein
VFVFYLFEAPPVVFQRAELARIQIAQRQNLDSINAVARQLSDALQRMARDNAANFDALNQRLWQVQSLTSTGLSNISRLSNRIDNNLAAPPPATDTTRGAGGGVIPDPLTLIGQARTDVVASRYASARRSLVQLLTTYPQAPEVADAYYWLGQAWEVEQPDSARFYYAKVFTGYASSFRAPTALYKLGNLELRSGNVAAAKRYWQMIVDKYKESPEFDSARESLRVNP